MGCCEQSHWCYGVKQERLYTDDGHRSMMPGNAHGWDCVLMDMARALMPGNQNGWDCILMNTARAMMKGDQHGWDWADIGHRSECVWLCGQARWKKRERSLHVAWTCFTNVKGWQDIVICLLSSMNVLAHSNKSKTLHKLNMTLNGTWIHVTFLSKGHPRHNTVMKEGVTWHDFPTHSAALADSSFWNSPLSNTPLSNVPSSKQQLLGHSTIKNSVLLTSDFGSLQACCPVNRSCATPLSGFVLLIPSFSHSIIQCAALLTQSFGPHHHPTCCPVNTIVWATPLSSPLNAIFWTTPLSCVLSC